MIIDSSALLAVLYRESDADQFDLLIATSECRMSVAKALEVAIVFGDFESRGALVIHGSLRFNMVSPDRP